MEYSNPKPPEGINVTPEHPLKEFAQLTVGMAVVIVAVVAVLAFGIGHLARLVPFNLEVQIADRYPASVPKESPQGRYLQRLADRLCATSPLPPGMRITMHYVDADVVNAMATVGGHVMVYRGLMQDVPSENALAMVVAHEIAHVRHRDPIVALGRGVVIGLGLAAISGATGSDVAGDVLGRAGLMTALSFNRAQERDADREALSMLVAAYGHAGGATAFFERMLERADTPGAEAVPAFMSSHPLTRERIASLRALAAERGWVLDGPEAKLPEF
ncbi:MAG: M48 family metallopeptidase [Gammaproteobacteria bacterium]